MHDGAHRLLAGLQSRSEVVPLLFVDVLEFEARNMAALAPNAVTGIIGFFSRLFALGGSGSTLRPIRPDVLARISLASLRRTSSPAASLGGS